MLLNSDTISDINAAGIGCFTDTKAANSVSSDCIDGVQALLELTIAFLCPDDVVLEDPLVVFVNIIS
jgi:hypothetical protein